MQPFNAAQWLIDRHAEDGRGDRVAVRCLGTETTYSELRVELWRVQSMLTEVGVGPEDRVVMVVQDDLAFPAWFLGAQRSGVIPVPVSTMLRGGPLGEIIADCGAKVLVLSGTFAAELPEMLRTATAVTDVVVAGEPSAVDAPEHVRVHLWEDWQEIGDQPATDTMEKLA